MSEMFELDGVPGDEIVAEMYFHIIFWTPKLKPALSGGMLAKVCEVMDQAMFTVDGEALSAGGGENHLHILARLSPEHTVQEALDTLRRCSEAFVARESGIKDFAWSQSELVVSISRDCLKTAKNFIENQASHHEVVSFQSELTAILDEHGMDYDERDLWD